MVYNPNTGFYEQIEVPDASPTSIVYSEDILIRNTWCFWFNQYDRKRQKTSYAVDAKCGTAINSYCQDDYALNWMKINDNTLPGTIGSLQRYHLSSLTKRDAENLSSLHRMWNLNNDTVISKQPSNDALTSPVGQKNLGAPFNNQAADSGGNGWRPKMHSDFIDLPLYDIQLWYYNIVIPHL